jgi:hypothetical protein
LWVEDGTPKPEALQARRRAVVLFWSGLGLFLLGAVTAIAASDGGVIWTGGLVVGGLMVVRAAMSYLQSTSLGLPHAGFGTWLGVGTGLLVCAGVGLGALASYFEAEEIHGGFTVDTNAVGSCWREGGDQMALVDCSSSEVSHTAVSEVASPDACPVASEIYLDGRPGFYLCLVHR